MKSNLCQHIKKDIIIIAVRIKPSDNYNWIWSVADKRSSACT